MFLRPDRWWANVLVGLGMVAIAVGNLDRTAVAVIVPLGIAMPNLFVAGILWNRHAAEAGQDSEGNSVGGHSRHRSVHGRSP